MLSHKSQPVAVVSPYDAYRYTCVPAYQNEAKVQNTYRGRFGRDESIESVASVPDVMLQPLTVDNLTSFNDGLAAVFYNSMTTPGARTTNSGVVRHKLLLTCQLHIETRHFLTDERSNSMESSVRVSPSHHGHTPQPIPYTGAYNRGYCGFNDNPTTLSSYQVENTRYNSVNRLRVLS